MPTQKENISVPKPACGGCCTKLQKLSVTLGGRKVLDEVDLHFHCGQLTAIIGPNGAGKSTLFKAILGEVPFGGTLKFIHSGSEEKFSAPKIGYVPQLMSDFVSIPLTVIDLFASTHQRLPIWWRGSRKLRADVEERLELVGATHLLNRSLNQLSVGETQRVLLAFALFPYPDLLLLDEPTSGLDHEGTSQFYKLVKNLPAKLDLSILLISHDLIAVSEVADRVVLLRNKVLKDGTPQEVMSDGIFSNTFGGLIVDPRLFGANQIRSALQDCNK